MKNMLSGIAQQLTKARDVARAEFERLDSAVQILNGSGHTNHRPKRRLSKEARGRIALAQRKRWAKTRASKSMEPKHIKRSSGPKEARRAEMERRGMLR